MGVPLREYQLYQLDILKEFARVCEEHNLTWHIGWGTLLGAARHQGFIPWDDDVDVCMPAEDYLKFREIAPTALGDEFYFQSHATNPANFITWQRIGMKNSTSLPVEYADIPAEWGVCIDIFQLAVTNNPEDEAGAQARKKMLEKFTKASKKYVYAHDAKKLTGLKKLYHLFMAAGSDEVNIAKWKKLEQAFLSGAGYGDPNYYDTPDSFCPIPAKCYEDITLLPFEGLMLPAPSGYKEILDLYYGTDWNELPPEEKRVWHSGGGSDEVIVSLTEPWTSFMK